MERTTRSKVIRFYKVLWDHHTEEEASWEREEFLRSAYPYMFPEQPNLEDEIYPKGSRFVTPWFLALFVCNFFCWFSGFGFYFPEFFSSFGLDHLGLIFLPRP